PGVAQRVAKRPGVLESLEGRRRGRRPQRRHGEDWRQVAVPGAPGQQELAVRPHPLGHVPPQGLDAGAFWRGSHPVARSTALRPWFHRCKEHDVYVTIPDPSPRPLRVASCGNRTTAYLTARLARTSDTIVTNAVTWASPARSAAAGSTNPTTSMKR